MIKSTVSAHLFLRLLGLMSLISLTVVLALTNSLYPAFAANFTVNTTVDGVDLNPGDGICLTSLGKCTLRAAVQEANARSGPDFINVPDGAYMLSVGGSGTDSAASNDLDITDLAGLTIVGSGSAFILTNNAFGVFDIRANVPVTITGVTIQNSKAPVINNAGLLTFADGAVKDNSIASIFDASPIKNTNALTLSNVIISGNTLASGFGSAIIDNGNSFQSRGKLVLLHSQIVDNSNMVGVRSFGSELTIDTVTISGNSNGGVTASSSADHSSKVIIRNSTISNNRALSGSGGVLFGSGGVSLSISGTAVITNTTISGNSAFINGGGLNINSDRSVVSLNNVTITDNRTTTSGGKGGGVYLTKNTLTTFGGTLTMKNSIVAGNNADIGPDCFTVSTGIVTTTVTSQGHNLIGNTAGCSLTGDLTGNILNQSPQLGPLQDNGGTTLTHAPISGSLVINAGSPDSPGSGSKACETTDQIGTIRPQEARCDMGAFEGAGGIAVSPVITGLNLSATTALGPGFPLTVNGNNFSNASVVRWNGANRPTTFNSVQQLTAQIPASDLLVGVTATVRVFNPTQGTQSNAAPFIVNNPKPTITRLVPNSARQGTFSLKLTITGTNFVPGSVVINTEGKPLSTTFISNNQLQALLPATEFSEAIIRFFRVSSPPPALDNGLSNQGFFTVTNRILPPLVGVGQVFSQVNGIGLLSTLTLSWTHPSSGWRKLDDLDLRLSDKNGKVALWLNFNEKPGENSIISLLNENGVIVGSGKLGDNLVLENDIAMLDLAQTKVDGPPGAVVSVAFGVIFKDAAAGQTFNIETYASDDEANGHGFERVGTLTVKAMVYLPTVIK